jgi:ADP-ribosyl-[dinitrogen reductase] hydrolase
MDNGVEDRALGCLIGLAVGDAVGTTLEFERRDARPPLTDMVGGGPFALAPGQWTDDTAMALALAESLVARPEFDAHDLMLRFVAWWQDGDYSCTGRCFDIGTTTRAALARYGRTGDPFAGSTDPESAGNGSLMRLAPVALHGVAGGDWRRIAREQSATTHGAAACLDACEHYGALLVEAIGGAGREAVLAPRVIGAVPEVAAAFAGSWQDKERRQIASSGYVVHSLEASLWCVGQTETFRDAVLLAANLGDDADTTAAITGQLAGALYGLSDMPEAWLARVAWADRLEGLGRQLLGCNIQG